MNDREEKGKDNTDKEPMSDETNIHLTYRLRIDLRPFYKTYRSYREDLRAKEENIVGFTIRRRYEGTDENRYPSTPDLLNRRTREGCDNYEKIISRKKKMA